MFQPYRAEQEAHVSKDLNRRETNTVGTEKCKLQKHLELCFL